MWSLHVERIWLHWLDQFCSQLQVLPWTPHLGKIFKKYPSAFFSLGKQLLGDPQNHYPHLTYQLLVVIVGYLWLSQLLVIINSVGYRCFLLLSFSVIGYQQCCWLSPLLLVIINAVGYHRCFLLLTYPVVGDHSLKLEKPLLALLLHKLHQTCLFHAIAVDISWNEMKSNSAENHNYIIFRFDQDLKVLISNRLQRSSSPLPCLIFVFWIYFNLLR